MYRRVSILMTIALLVACAPAARAALSAYTQSFEGLVQSNPTALGDEGWVVYGNVYSPDHSTHLYGYGTFPAPNGGSNFCAIAAGEGGVEQGAQQLSVYSDYNNTDHGLGRWIESNTFREQTIGAPDVGNTWMFQFDAKLGNLLAPSTALAFIKTLNPSAGYATTNFLTVNTTAIPNTWNTYSVEIAITPDLVGQILQFGFSNQATNYQSSGVFYDNVDWKLGGTTSVGPERGAIATLRPASPNPFRSATRFEFAMAREGDVTLAIYDLAGRKVATLFDGRSGAGPQTVSWNGRTDDGHVAPAGVYHAALKHPDGRVTRTVVIAR